MSANPSSWGPARRTWLRPAARFLGPLLGALLGAALSVSALAAPRCVVPEGPERARLAVDADIVLVARDGALVERSASGEVVRLHTPCEGLPGPHPQALASFGSEVAIGFRSAGLALYDGETFRAVPALPDDAVRALAEDGERLWIGTGRSGLYWLDSEGTHALHHHVLGRREISALHVDQRGALHIGAGMYGWWKLAAKVGARPRRIERGVYAGCFSEALAGRPKPLAPGPACGLRPARPLSGLPSGHISSLVEHEGRLWIGSFDRGLAVAVSPGRFEPRSGPRLVNAMLSDGPTLWVATPSGLWRVQGDARASRVPLGLASEHINGLALAPGGALWMATGQGLAVLEPDGRVRSLTTAAGLPSRRVYSVDVGPDGAIWAGTAAGAVRLGPEGAKTWTRSSGALPHDWVHAIHADPLDPEAALAGTYDAGVVRLHPDGTSSPIDGLEAAWVNPSGLFPQADGALLVATLGDGLLAATPSGPDGPAGTKTIGPLPSEDVTAAIQWGGELWVGTRGGLVVFESRYSLPRWRSAAP